MTQTHSLRDLTIDRLRGLAIVLMLIQHTPSYLMRNVSASPYYTYIFWITRISAPLFFVIAGYCIYLSSQKRDSLHNSTGFFCHLLRRSVLLFILGCLVNLFRYTNLFSFNVLHCIAISILITGILYIVQSKLVYLITCGALVLYSFIEPFISPNPSLGTLLDVPQWLLTTGVFPIASWCIYFLIGLGFAWFDLKKDLIRNTFLLTGGALFLSSLLIQHYLHKLPQDFYLIAISSLKFQRGHNNFIFLFNITIILIFIYSIFLNPKVMKHTWVSNTLAIFGRHSLLVYVGHQFIFQMIPNSTGMKNVLSLRGVIFIFFLFLVLLLVFLNKYESIQNRKISSRKILNVFL